MKKINKLKYELTNEVELMDGRELHRIRSLKNFGDVTKGQLGGFVESDDNLSQEGNCWIYDNAVACDNSRVYNNARIRNEAIIMNEVNLYDDVIIMNNSKISDNVTITDTVYI